MGLDLAWAQDLPTDEDPFIDPVGVRAIMEPQKRFNEDQGFLVGIMYGLNPVIVFSPGISFAIYKDPFIAGLEISDSDKISIWAKQRKEGLGPSRLGGTTVFGKWFIGSATYVMAAYEDRYTYLWERSYDRPPGGGKARYDIFIESTVASLGIGYMRYGRLGFMAMDIVRYSMVLNRSVRVVEHWETWSSKGLRKDLDWNIAYVRDDWYDVLDSPSAVLVTVGLFF